MKETIIGTQKSVDQRLSEYNEKRKALDDEYGFLLVGEPFIENGFIKARPALVPVETIPNGTEVPEAQTDAPTTILEGKE